MIHEESPAIYSEGVIEGRTLLLMLLLSKILLFMIVSRLKDSIISGYFGSMN